MMFVFTFEKLGVQSLNWANIMKIMTKGPDGFFDNGGWTFLDPESDGKGKPNDDTEDKEDDAYEPTKIEDEFYSVEFSEASDRDGSGSDGTMVALLA
ncbi:hypothetical protein RP20_CCG011705 [Aedes albopictus]|nr:hypothetical protein RP20_CCG011705 [Aedes albopictus]